MCILFLRSVHSNPHLYSRDLGTFVLVVLIEVGFPICNFVGWFSDLFDYYLFFPSSILVLGVWGFLC